jgi:hypothetical protein
MPSTETPPESADRRPAWLTPLAAVAAVLLVAWQLKTFFEDVKFFPPDDVVEYWAAGRLNAEGKNPYDPNLLLPLQQTTGRADTLPENHPPGEQPRAVMMWNPPWTLTLVMPLGLLPARLAQLVWLLWHLGVIFWCADKIWRLYGGPVERRALAWLLAGSFLPTAMVIQAGQITPFLLLGCVGFLHFERRRQDMLAGMAAALLGVKPHLVYLFWIALVVWSIRTRRWGVILGGGVAGLVASAIPLACNPDVFWQYREAFRKEPPDWMSATPGAVLRLGFLLCGMDRYWLQFVPTGLGGVWLLTRLWRRRFRDWCEELPLLLLVSFATAAYGAWHFDLVLLLLPIVRQAALLARPEASEKQIWRGVAWYGGIEAGMAGMKIAGVDSFWFVWVAPAVLLAYNNLTRMTGEASAETVLSVVPATGSAIEQ